MSTETVPEKNAPTASENLTKHAQLGSVVSSVLHRVCIQCNNMFRVTADKFDAKQCPACHKG